MPGAAHIPDLERQLASLIGRVEALERQRRGFGPPEPEPGAITSHLHIVAADATYDSIGGGYLFTPMTEESRCGDDDVTIAVAGDWADINTDGIYTFSFHVNVAGEDDTVTAGGWATQLDLNAAAYPDWSGPYFEGALADDGGFLSARATVSWTGRCEAGDYFRFLPAVVGSTGTFEFSQMNAWVVRLGDCP